MKPLAIDTERLVALYREHGSLVQVAQILGISDRTITRHRQADPDLDRNLTEARQQFLTARREAKPHGTRARYPFCTAGPNGGKCEKCRLANKRSKVHGDRLRARLPFHLIPHGLNGYRNYSCRCETCRQAGSADNRAYRQARQQREREAA